MLESIEILENFDDLNRTQKYQLKVPLFRNEKQYITDLENNVTYFLNQIGKNNYITEDQMEVIMPQYIQKEKKRRVNRAKMQAEKVRKEIANLRQEERLFGKARFQFANELPDTKKNLHPEQPPFTTSLPSSTRVLKYIATEEYKDYKYQYKPYVPSPYEQSLNQRTHHIPKSDFIMNRSSTVKNLERNTSMQQESLLMEKSQAYLMEQSKMNSKWQNVFTNIDDKRGKAVSSSDNLIKTYKQGGNTILKQPSRMRHIEPTEDELLVSNNNLTINEILNNTKQRTLPHNLRTPDNYIFQEFIQLSKQSLESLAIPNAVSNTSKTTLKNESKQLNIKLHQIKKDNGTDISILNFKVNIHSTKDKFVLFKQLKSHFQPILEKNKAQIMTRIFLALDINPHEEYSKVKWNEYFLFNKIVVDQSANMFESVNFIIKFFGIHEKKYMRVMEFVALLRMMCSKFDEFLVTKGRMTIFELLEENLTVLQLLKPGTEFLSLSDFRALLLAHRINYQIILQLIVQSI